MKKILTYFIVFTLITLGNLSAQNRTITGKVTTETGESVAGVTIIVKGTTIGAFTKADGSFKISVPKSATTLVFRRLGMRTKEVELGSNDELKINLAEDRIQTDEVVVTAIGLEREKKSLGYSTEELKGSSIVEARTTDFIDGLQGKVAGVSVTSSAGTPGASSFITMRGISSITGENQPLFVVDGVPIDNSMSYSGNPDNGSNNLTNGVAYSNRGIDLNPDDIESITVLKGPAASALYGIRAGTGAIIITTKKGTIGTGEKINVSFTTSTSWDVVSKLPDLQTKFAQGDKGNTVNPGTRSPNWSFGGLLDTLRYSSVPSKFDKNGTIVGMSDPTATTKKVVPYNNLDDFFRPAPTFTNTLSLAGGSDIGTYYLSLGNTSAQGIVPNSTFDRTSVRLTGESNISSRLKASASVNYINSGGTRIQQGSNLSGVMLGLLRTPITFDNSNGFGRDAVNNPSAYEFNTAGYITQRTYRGQSGDGKARYDNPFWTVNENPFKDNVDRMIGNFQLSYYVADWMDITYRAGVDEYSDNRKQIFAIGSGAFLNGQVFESSLYNNILNSDLLFNFNYKFSDDWKGKLTLGNNAYQEVSNYIYDQGDGLVIPGFYNLNNTQSQLARQSKSKMRRASFYGDLSLNYLDWLYLNGNVRNEWSTTLPEDNNSFMFGSGNVSFVYTDAFKNLFEKSILSMGKIRVNYAVVGNDAPLYGTTTPFGQSFVQDGWTTGIPFPYNGTVGYSKSAILGSSTLKPEKITSKEIGFVFSLFENLINLDFTYYNSISSDQIVPVHIAGSSGYQYQLTNIGQISNKGIEILLNITPIKSLDFRWDFSLNFAKNTNNVDILAPGITNLYINGFTGSSIRAVAGKPYGQIFGPGYQRDSKGNVVIDDRQTLSDGSPNSEYGKPFLDPVEKDWGSYQPDWTMGIRNSFTWKGITLSFLFDIKQGGKMLNGTKGVLNYFGRSSESLNRGSQVVFQGIKGHLDALGNVVTSGTNDIKTILDEDWYTGTYGGFSNNTEAYVEDASWVRLREVSLSYMLPKSIVSYTPLSEISVTFTGRNLWLKTPYSGVDPETSLFGSSNAQGYDYFNMPGTKTYTFTLNVKF